MSFPPQRIGAMVGLMRTVIFAIAIGCEILVTGCSSGGGKSASPIPQPVAGAANAASVTVKMVIPNTSVTSATTRKPAFVSPSTNGVSVTTYAHTDTNHATPLGTSVTDVSAGSSACTATAGARSCTVSLTTPPGPDDFVFSLYDTAPVNGAIPAAAHLLGSAGITQTITAGAANVVNAGINAIVVGLSGQAALVPLAADGTVHNVGLTIAPTDFGNNPIVAGAANSAFANPITVTATESGGTGHAFLQLNGGSGSAQVTVTKSTDTVQVVYDGLGSAGYQVSVALSAPAIAGQGGAKETAVLKPILFVSNPTVFFTAPAAATPAQIKTYPEGKHLLAISEPSAAAGTTFTAIPTGCSNVLSVGTTVGTGTNATLLVVGGTTLATAGCSLAISDGTVSYTIGVSNTLRAFNPPAFLHEYPVTTGGLFAVLVDITTGPDGNLWFTDGTGAMAAIGSIKPDGTGNVNRAATGYSAPAGITAGPDGNIWVGDSSINNVGKITPAGTITTYTTQSLAFENSVTPGLDGLTWFSECQFNKVGSRSTSGTLSEVTIAGGNIIQAVTLGPDGAIWFTDRTDLIGRIANGAGSEFAARTTSRPRNLTAGSDGNVWFTEDLLAATTAIGRMTPSGTLTEFTLPGDDNFITAGPDGAIWFTDDQNNAIGRITTSGTITEYTIPTAFAFPYGITVGPDGNIWFAERGATQIGVLQI
jgi:streptogramin lyase